MKGKRSILTRSVRKFLREPRTARLATIGRDGYPHLIPIWFALDGDDIIFGSDNHEQKVKNALRNPRAGVVIGGEPEQDDAGYMIQGDITIEENPSHKSLRRLFYQYESKQEAEERLKERHDDDTVLIRLKPRKVIRVW